MSGEPHLPKGGPPEARPGGPLRRVLVATDFSRGASAAVERAARLPFAESGGTLFVVHVVPDIARARMRREAEQDARQGLEQAVAAAQASQREVRALPRLEAVLLRGKAFKELNRCARQQRVELVVLGGPGRPSMRDRLLGTTGTRIIRKGSASVLVVKRGGANPYRRPLLVLDLSEASQEVVAMALRVLGPVAEPLPVFHAYNVPFEHRMELALSKDGMAQYRADFRKTAANGLLDMLEGLGQLGVGFKPVIRSGDPCMTLLREFVKQRADLVALGTRNRSSAAKVLLGSVAEWIVGSAPCDVLVTRPRRVAAEAS